MAAIDVQEIDLFSYADRLPPVLWDDLAARDPQEAALACGAKLADGCFELDLVGRSYRVDPTARTVLETAHPSKRVGYQAGMILVTALAGALGVPPTGEMVTPQELPGGSMFFVGPHAVPTEPIAQAFGGDPSSIYEAATILGGHKTQGADAAVKLSALPMVPMWVLVWGGDEEFEANAVIGVDSRAHHHLALDVVWAMCNLLSSRLSRASQ